MAAQHGGQPIAAFYLNLATRPDRRAHMEDGSLPRAGIVAERIDAVHAPPGADDHDVCAAVTASHVLALERIAGLPATTWGLVLEDDVVFMKDFRRHLDQVLASLLGRHGWLMYLDAHHLQGWDFGEGGNCHEDGVLPCGGDCTLASAYLIAPAAARWVLQRRAEEQWLFIESLLLRLQEAHPSRCFVVLPRLALQLWAAPTPPVESRSNIQPATRSQGVGAWFRDVYFKRYAPDLYDWPPAASFVAPAPPGPSGRTPGIGQLRRGQGGGHPARRNGLPPAD